MPKGLARIDQLAKDAKARSDAYASGEGFQRALMLKDGQTAKGRFLEDGEAIWYLYVHDLPRKPGQQYSDKVLCLDQPFTDAAVANYVEGSTKCRGCEIEGVGRPTRVIINFIRYDEPKLARDAKGEPIKNGNEYVFDGVAPALVVCNFATGVGGRLAFLESQYKVGIANHVCTIHKTGDKNNPFMIDVVEANKPPEPWEIEIFNKKVAPPQAVKELSPKYKSLPLMSYGDMVRAYGGAAAGFADAAAVQAAPTGNVYADSTAGGGLNPGAFAS